MRSNLMFLQIESVIPDVLGIVGLSPWQGGGDVIPVDENLRPFPADFRVDSGGPRPELDAYVLMASKGLVGTCRLVRFAICTQAGSG